LHGGLAKKQWAIVVARRQIVFARELIQCFADSLGALSLAHRPMNASVDSDYFFIDRLRVSRGVIALRRNSDSRSNGN
jgi:hypothetical protein